MRVRRADDRPPVLEDDDLLHLISLRQLLIAVAQDLDHRQGLAGREVRERLRVIVRVADDFRRAARGPSPVEFIAGCRFGRIGAKRRKVIRENVDPLVVRILARNPFVSRTQVARWIVSRAGFLLERLGFTRPGALCARGVIENPLLAEGVPALLPGRWVRTCELVHCELGSLGD